MSDLSNFKPKSETVQVFLKDSNGDPIMKNDKVGMSITLYATHTSEYKGVMHAIANKRLQRAQKSKKMNITSEDIERAGLERLVNITKSWDIILDGKAPALTEDNVKAVYTELSWIVEQLEDGLEDNSSFTKA